jgi:hypothetical protein
MMVVLATGLCTIDPLQGPILSAFCVFQKKKMPPALGWNLYSFVSYEPSSGANIFSAKLTPKQDNPSTGLVSVSAFRGINADVHLRIGIYTVIHLICFAVSLKIKNKQLSVIAH